MRFIYVGGGAWLPGYPASDIDDISVYTDEQIAEMLASGLWEPEEMLLESDVEEEE